MSGPDKRFDSWIATPEEENSPGGLWNVETGRTPEGCRIVSASYCTREHAQLFAAAPDLLAALQALVERGTDSPEHMAAEAAIAKATGHANSDPAMRRGGGR